MASKDEDLYYEFLYPKICIGAPIHLCSLLFAGTAGALALCKFVRQDLYTEKVVRQKLIQSCCDARTRDAVVR